MRYILISMMVTISFAMDFDIETFNKGNYRFRVVDFDQLDSVDRDHFVQHTQDYELFLEMYGEEIAQKSKEMNQIDPEATYKAGVIYQKKPQSTDWFVDCLDLDNAFVGHLSLAPSINELDSLEIVLSMSKDYRDIGIGSQLSRPLFKKLSSFKEFQGKKVGFGTLIDNLRVHRLAENLGFEKTGQVTKELHFWDTTISLQEDEFTGKLKGQ